MLYLFESQTNQNGLTKLSNFWNMCGSRRARKRLTADPQRLTTAKLTGTTTWAPQGLPPLEPAPPDGLSHHLRASSQRRRGAGALQRGPAERFDAKNWVLVCMMAQFWELQSGLCVHVHIESGAPHIFD